MDIFGGEEKLKIQIDNDSLKREFCSRNGIRELEIKYTDSVEEKLKSYKNRIFSKAGHTIKMTSGHTGKIY